MNLTDADRLLVRTRNHPAGRMSPFTGTLQAERQLLADMEVMPFRMALYLMWENRSRSPIVGNTVEVVRPARHEWGFVFDINTQTARMTKRERNA
jgi:hypothetical protein